MQADGNSLNRKLHRLSQIYKLPSILNENLTVVTSSTNLDTYKSLILPTHVLTNSSDAPLTSNQDLFENFHDDANLGLNSNSDSALNGNSADTSNGSKMGNPAVIIGHCIVHNGGIPINNLSKIPSYQWGFKHEDETSSHSLINETFNSNSHLNSEKSSNYMINSNLDNLSNIPSGLGALNGNSISTLAGNITTNSSMGLNSRMVRMPIYSSNINSYDSNNYLKVKEADGTIIQGGSFRSLMNGLPYFNHEQVDQKIRNLNLIKKLNFKASNTNTSWFSEAVNQTIDDIEYLHGEVILNQFVNNKRVIRNYQWLLYWDKKINGNTLNDELYERYQNQKLTIMTVKDFKKLVDLRRKKFLGLLKEKQVLVEKLNNVKITKAEKLRDYKLAHNSVSNDIPKEVAAQIYGEDLLSREKELNDQISKVPESEQELEFSPLDVANIETTDGEITVKNIAESSRFRSNLEFNESQEIIYERELPINDSLLIKYQNQLYGVRKSLKMQNDVKSKHGIITSKIVKIKKSPNPNALGFSNIRRRKPSFL